SFFLFQAEDGIRDRNVTGVQTCALPISPPYDQTVEVRDAMVGALQEVGFNIERFHREVGSGGQQEINYRFNTMLHAADDIQTFKYVIKNTAVAFNKTATFMPKPLAGDNGSGMHA